VDKVYIIIFLNWKLEVSHVKGFETSDPQFLGHSCCTNTYIFTYYFPWVDRPWWTRAVLLSRLWDYAQTHHNW